MVRERWCVRERKRASYGELGIYGVFLDDEAEREGKSETDTRASKDGR